MPFEKPATPKGEEEKSKIGLDDVFDETSRRMFLMGAAGLTITAGVEKVLFDGEGAEDGNKKKEQQSTFERRFEHGFQDEMAGYGDFYERLHLDEVMFVDEGGRPVGEHFKIEEIDGISPGEKDQDGILKGELRQEWLDHVRQKLHADHPDVQFNLKTGLPRQMNLVFLARELKSKALREEDIHADTYLEVVKHFGSKPVVGAPDKTRIEYLREHVMDKVKLSATLQKELSFVLPGLAAQESKYNNNSQSSVKAFGILQFMPDTWKSLGYSDAEKNQFKVQVEAAGKFFEAAHHFITRNDDGALDKIKKEFFGDDQQAFEGYFLAPVLVNSYNSGPGRLVHVLKAFCAEYPNRKKFEEATGLSGTELGYDVFLAATKVASRKVSSGARRVPGYGRDSSQYAIRAYTLAKLLAK